MIGVFDIHVTEYRRIVFIAGIVWRIHKAYLYSMFLTFDTNFLKLGANKKKSGIFRI